MTLSLNYLNNHFSYFCQAITPLALNIPEATEEFLRSTFPGVELMSFYGTNEIGMLSLGKTCKNIGQLCPNIVMKVSEGVHFILAKNEVMLLDTIYGIKI